MIYTCKAHLRPLRGAGGRGAAEVGLSYYSLCNITVLHIIYIIICQTII